MKVILQIIDLNGRIVKEIRESVAASGFRYGPIQWNGNSENGLVYLRIYIYSTARLSNGKNNNSGRLILTLNFTLLEINVFIFVIMITK